MRNLLKLVFVLLLGSQLLACSAAEEVAASCAPVYSCPTNGSTTQACCTDSSCWFTAGSQSFYCVSPYDCYDASYDLAAYCYAKTSAKSETDLATSLGIEKVKNIQLNQSIDQMYMDLGNEAQQAQ